MSATMHDPARHGQPRLPRVEPESASAAQRAVLEELLAARGKPGGRLANLYAMMLHQPEIARRMGAIGAYCRFHSTPPEMIREVAILTACYVLSFEYEIRAHEEIIRDRGMSDDEVRALKAEDWSALPERYAVVGAFVRAAIAGDPHDDLVERVRQMFGVGGLIDLTAMAAHYSALAVYGRVLRPEPDPPGMSLARPLASGR